MRVIVENGLILNGSELESGKSLVIEGRSIERITDVPDRRPKDLIVDAHGGYVLPGLVDIHTHGLRDVIVDSDDIFRFAQLQLEYGVTACLPTLAGSPPADMARMKRILSDTADFSLTPNLVGFRPEIMYLADASGGPSASLARPDAALTEAVWEASAGRIRIWDVSPEIEGAMPFISWCASRGIAASMAHSAADIDTVRRAVDAGLRLVTHLYDLFPLPREVDEGVYPAGVTDYINVEDRLCAELIPDGVHAHPLLVETTLRCKGLDRVAFITDSLKGSGNPPGTFDGLIPGEPVEVTPDRGIRRISDGVLTGSALTQLQSLRNAVGRLGRTVAEASRLCARTPARIAGLETKGALAPGMDADVLILDADLEVRAVILGGRVVKS